MSTRRRRKTSRTRRIDGKEAQQRQAVHASAAFWHGGAPAQAVSPQPADPQAVSPQAGDGADAAADGASSDNGAGAGTPGADLWPPQRRISPAAVPAATVRSLGKPPLAGREAAAEHYFDLVYERSVAMAAALAAAGDLLDADPGP